MDDSARVRITEIFYSLQGEAASVGWPTVFVRLTGCPLRCGYCDTAYAFQGGRRMTVESVLSEVQAYGAQRVCVTGGEPLAQKECGRLLAALCEAGYEVSLETSGAIALAGIDPRVSIVMDLKTPGSGEQARNLYENLSVLRARDQVKFVLCDRPDYEWSREQVRTHHLDERCEVLFSPVHGRLEPRVLADWILADRLRVRFQIQIHKLLWNDAPGH